MSISKTIRLYYQELLALKIGGAGQFGDYQFQRVKSFIFKVAAPESYWAIKEEFYRLYIFESDKNGHFKNKDFVDDAAGLTPKEIVEEYDLYLYIGSRLNGYLIGLGEYSTELQPTYSFTKDGKTEYWEKEISGEVYQVRAVEKTVITYERI